MDVAYWTHNEQNKLQLLNLGTADDPKLVKLNANLNPQLTTDATSLFKKYETSLHSPMKICEVYQSILLPIAMNLTPPLVLATKLGTA